MNDELMNVVTVGTAVQIGLHASLELDFLSSAGYREVEHDINQSHPFDWGFVKMFGFDVFHVFGIDADPESVRRMTKEYKLTDNIQIVNACVSGISRQLNPVIVDLDYTASQPHERILVPTLSLEDLFQCLPIEEGIDVLLMDIDGAEWDVFAYYPWTVKPTHVIMEVTEIHEKTKADFIALMTEAGYECYFEASLETSRPSYNLQFEYKGV